MYGELCTSLVLPDLVEGHCPQLVHLRSLYKTCLQEFFLGGLSSHGGPQLSSALAPPLLPLMVQLLLPFVPAAELGMT